MADEGWTGTVVSPHAPRAAGPAWIAIVAIAYVACGLLGMAVAVQQVSAVWAPSGLALAAVLLFGPRAAIGVALGSLLLNLGYGFEAGRPGASVTVATALAAGATLEALVGRALLLAGIAITGTVHHRGTFAHSSLSESLAFLQAFIGVIAVTTLVLCAVIEERASRTRALLRARDEAQVARAAAEEANRAKTMFLASASHELRTPLNHIIGYGEMLAEDAEADGRTEAARDIAKLLRSAKDLLTILSAILDMAQLEAGTLQMASEEFDAGPIVEDVKAACAPLAEMNKDTLSTRVAEGLGRLRGDRAKVRQALLHLVDNACKFTRGGSVSVEVAREESAGGAWAAFKVTDTGIGLSPQQMVGLFRPFVQGDGSTTREYGGLGLGLAVSRQFARKMGGEITVASAPGKGSTFTMRLPL